MPVRSVEKRTVCWYQSPADCWPLVTDLTLTPEAIIFSLADGHAIRRVMWFAPGYLNRSFAGKHRPCFAGKHRQNGKFLLFGAETRRASICRLSPTNERFCPFVVYRPCVVNIEIEYLRGIVNGFLSFISSFVCVRRLALHFLGLETFWVECRRISRITEILRHATQKIESIRLKGITKINYALTIM